MVKYLICFITINLLLWSCTVNEDFTPTDFEPQVVLNGYLQQDSAILRLTLSNPSGITIIENPFRKIDDASISILDTDSQTTLATIDGGNNGLYNQSINLPVSTNLALEADVPGYGVITSRPTFIPQPVMSLGVSLDDVDYFTNRATGLLLVELEGNVIIQPQPNEVNRTNTYFIEVAGYKADTIIPLSERDNLDIDLAISCGIIGDVGIIFTSACFPGNEISIPFIANGLVSDELDSLKVTAYTLPGDFHEYALIETQGSDPFESLFTQPDISASNIIGGLGFVSGRNAVSVTIDLP